MGDLLNAKALDLFLFFFVPGFVALSVYDLIVPSAQRNLSEAVIQIISFSMINLLLWFWLIEFMARDDFRSQHGFWYTIVVISVNGVSPTVLACAMIWLRKSRFLRGKVLHPAPTGWDFFFDQRKPCFVRCRMKTGALFGGYFGAESFASAHPVAQELYLERVWEIDDKGVFRKPVDGSSGTIVRMDECEIIELLEVEEKK